MIRLDNITKYYQGVNEKKYIFESVSFSIPDGHNIAILGANGAGKSTLFRLIAGSEYPDSGSIITDKKLSWPVALSTGIHPQMTGRENTRFIGRINGVAELDNYCARVEAFAAIKDSFDLPVQRYSSGMRSRLAFACSLCIDFDIYLIDEITAVGDAAFKRKAKEALKEKSKNANIIMVSHQMAELRTFCDSAIVINNGQLSFFQNIEDGIKVYENL